MYRDEDGKKHLKDQIDRFSPYITQYKKIAAERGLKAEDHNDMLNWMSSQRSPFRACNKKPRALENVRRKRKVSCSATSSTSKIIRMDQKSSTTSLLVEHDNIRGNPEFALVKGHRIISAPPAEQAERSSSAKQRHFVSQLGNTLRGDHDKSLVKIKLESEWNSIECNLHNQEKELEQLKNTMQIIPASQNHLETKLNQLSVSIF